MRFRPVRLAISFEAWHCAQVSAIRTGWMDDAGLSRLTSVWTGPWQVWQAGLPEIWVKTGLLCAEVARASTTSWWQVAQSTGGTPVSS